MRVEYHPAVEAELREIQGYYDQQSPGLGTRFLDEFERQLVALVAHMNTRRRRWLGGSLLGASVLTALMLISLGMPLVSLERGDSHEVSGGSAMFQMWIIDVGWPMVVLLATSLIGFVLLVFPNHGGTKAR